MVVGIKPYSGMTYQDVISAFKDTLRNTIAHLSPSGNVVNPDDIDDVRRCEAAIPVMQHIGRALLMMRYKAETGGTWSSGPTIPRRRDAPQI
jgi:hypothetical protein